MLPCQPIERLDQEERSTGDLSVFNQLQEAGQGIAVRVLTVSPPVGAGTQVVQGGPCVEYSAGPDAPRRGEFGLSPKGVAPGLVWGGEPDVGISERRRTGSGGERI